MKSKILCLCALILGLVSCQQDGGTNVPVQERVRFTASVETTRTILGDDLSVLWEADDYIQLWYADENGSWAFDQLQLIEGAGTDSGVFEGIISKPISNYRYATYGEDWYSPYDASIIDQSYVPNSFGSKYDAWNFGGLASAPMIANVEADNTNLLFKNVMGIIQLHVAGSGVLESISLHDKNETVALNGNFSFDPDTLSIPDWFWKSYYTSLQNINVELGEESQPFYLVLPPTTIDELEVTFYFNNATDNVTFTATNPITISRGVITPVQPAINVTAPTKDWHIVGSINGWDVENGIVMETVEGTELVAAYGIEMAYNDEFKFVYGTSWGSEIGNSYYDYAYAGYYYYGQSGGYGGNITVGKSGTYDIYLDPTMPRFYIVNAGDDWSDTVEYTLTNATFSVIGDLLNESWSVDHYMSYMGEGLYFAENIIFADVNDEGAVFKIRLDSNWDRSFGVSSGNNLYEVDSPIDVSLGGSNIPVDAIIGISYDVWFDVAERKVWVTHHGYMPGQTVEIIEHQMPYMYGVVADSDQSSYRNFVQFVLSQTHIYDDWTAETQGYNNFLFTIYYNEISMPARIILNDDANTCLMSNTMLNGLFHELREGKLMDFTFFDTAVMNVTDGGIEVYATIGPDIHHIVYSGELKLGFQKHPLGNSGTETFVQLQEFNPEWK